MTTKPNSAARAPAPPDGRPSRAVVTSGGRRDTRAGVFLAVGVVVLGLNLRPAIVAVSPILPVIRQDTRLSTAAAGLLTTLPLLCFGFLAPLAPRLGRRFGTELVLLAAMLAICAGTALRLIPSTAALLGGTVVIGVGIALANVLFPVVIKRDSGSRVGLMTGLYSMSLSIGAALAAGVTVPLEHVAHTDWRTTLALWGLLAVLAVVVMALRVQRPVRRVADEGRAVTQPVRGMWRNPVAWTVTAFMGVQSLGYYAATAYLPSILTDAGLSPGQAGWMLSVSNLLGIAAAFTAPTLAVRRGRPGQLAILAAIFTAGGLAGLIFAPAPAVYLWIVLLGFGQSAAGPLALGFVHQTTDGWTVPIVVLLVLLVPQTLAGLGAARHRYAAPSAPTP